MNEFVTVSENRTVTAHGIFNNIYADTTMDVNDADEIRKRAERIFNSSTYRKQVERSKKNWLDLSVDEVLKKDLQFIYKV